VIEIPDRIDSQGRKRKEEEIMCSKSFPGILNSAVCPLERDVADGLENVHDFDMVIAYMQHAFFVQNAYDARSDRFANLTPAKYREVMNRCMDIIDRDMMLVLEKATNELSDAMGEVD
jgi:hypothetical protein